MSDAPGSVKCIYYDVKTKAVPSVSEAPNDPFIHSFYKVSLLLHPENRIKSDNIIYVKKEKCKV